MAPHSTTVEEFQPHTTDDELDDLRSRLAATRLPEPATSGASTTVDDWSQGVPVSRLAEVIDHWRTEYDWRAFEARLSRTGQFRTTIDGLGIHFLHRRSPAPGATPLILTHGWPGSVAEFARVIDELAEPRRPGAPAFHVVAPSLPGFGYSDKPSTTGWGVEAIAAAWVTLMGRLGYDRFLAHGGDWGHVVTTILGGRYADHVVGTHTTVAQPPPGLSAEVLTAEERAWADDARDFWDRRAAYATLMAASPQTIGYSLVDSPAGLLAWILDKFAEWTDSRREPFGSIPLDAILDNVSLYWFTRSGASSARIYRESHDSLDPDLRVDVPAAVTVYPKDIERWPRPWAEQRFRQIVRWRTPRIGGHFPSLETPDDFVEDLQDGLGAVLAASEHGRC